jgi:hypothetical protein
MSIYPALDLTGADPAELPSAGSENEAVIGEVLRRTTVSAPSRVGRMAALFGSNAVAS